MSTSERHLSGARKVRAAVFASLLILAAVAHAADGSWTNSVSAPWNGTTNWLSGIVAGGMDYTAFFTNVNLTTSVQVMLETPLTIGTIHAADPVPASLGWWDINNGGFATNTLQVTNVVVESFATDRGVALYARLTGDNALAKSGEGRLVLVEDNDYTGGTTVGEGTLQVGNAGTTGSIGTGAVHVAESAVLFYYKSSSGTVGVPHGAGISGDGALSVTAGKIALDGDTAIGGAVSLTQNSATALYNGIDLNTDVTLAASSISITGDIGQHNTARWDMLLDTSAVNGPVNLDISLGRNGVWYNLNSFTVNAGTGPINFSGGRLGAGGAGFRGTSATLTGAVNMPVNLYTESVLTVNATANGRISGVIYGTGGSLVKTGPGTLTLSGRNTYTGRTFLKGGTLALGQPAVNGAARHFDASNLGVANGAAVSQWNDLSGNGHHATVPTSNSNVAPTYIADAGTGTGLGALNFLRNSNAGNSSALWFTRDSSIRTVFSIFKGASFLLTDNTDKNQTYHFHRPEDFFAYSPIHSNWTSPNIKNGQTYINGVLQTNVLDNMPTTQHNGYNLIEIITTGNVIADSFNKDRYTIHAGNQSHAEMLIFDRAFSESERLETEAYLMKKWFGIGDGAGDALPTATELIMEGDSVLDMSGLQRQTVGSLFTYADTEIDLADAVLIVNGEGDISGEVTGAGGRLVKQGSGTLLLRGTASYAGATIVTGGVLQVVNIDVPATNPVPGATRWFDASSLSLTNGEQVTQWNDLSGNGAHAVNNTGSRVPVYATDAVNGLGAVFFDSFGGNDTGHYLRFNRESGIRTVFSVFRGASFLLTDEAEYHFHRPGDGNPTEPLWVSYTSENIKNGQTYVNGVQVDGIAYNLPSLMYNGFNLIEVVTAGNVQANTFNKDRTYHSGKQYHGEVIIYNRVLTESERLAVERYLMRKWLGYSYSGSLPNAPVVLGGGATLDPGGTSAALGTLTMVGDAAIALGDGSATLSFADSSTESWTGTLTLTGALGPGSVRFGTNASALTREQLDSILWDGRQVSLDSSGYLVRRMQGTLIMVQ